MEPTKMLALTFDDGPNDSTMAEILDLLSQYGARATFFVIGQNITEAAVPVLRRAISQGCEIGNHSQSHLHMSRLTPERIRQEVGAVQQKAEALLGVSPTLFRPPYIDISDTMRTVIPMPFIIGSGNNDWDPACTLEQRTELALSAASDGAILLMHCTAGNAATVTSLCTILPELRRQGYQMLTVSQLFAAKGASLENGMTYSNAGGKND